MRFPRLSDIAGRFGGLFGRKDLFISLADRPTSVFDRTRYGANEVAATYANVVMAPVMWAMRTFTEANAVVQAREGGLWVNREEHALADLIDTPNPFYDGDALWKATVLSYMLNGNAYWWKIRNAFGDVVQLWWLPHWAVVPMFPIDGSQFITYYQYTPIVGMGGATAAPIAIAPRDLVHIRFGLDLQNPRLGISTLRVLLQEVMTDQQAAEFSEVILKNMGVPGLMISPKDANSRVTPDQVTMLKSEVEAAFSGSKRGKTFVMGAPTEVTQFGFDPNKLALPNLRDTAEERVTAMLGIPAAVVGFGAGLQSTKVGATMRELVRLARINCINPMQNSMGRQLTHQLMPDFVSQTKRFRLGFDSADVTVFEEEQNMSVERTLKAVQAGVLRVDRAQAKLGLEVDETQKVYLRPTTTIPAGPDAPPDPSRNFPEGGDPAEAAATTSGDGADASAGEADTQKMLAAIAKRVGLPNGNGRN